jgi:GNAT superfamily N-acetyltransferase
VDRFEMSFRRLALSDLDRLGEVDRTERIEGRYVQDGTRLVLQVGDWSSPPWQSEGEGEHSVAHQRAECERHLAEGGIALGAFVGERLAGIGLVRPHIRPGVAQLAYLHVSDGRRRLGVGGRLARDLERIAGEAGNQAMVVSATPSTNTVDFYMHLGYEPIAEPLPELYALEPEDIHMLKSLPAPGSEPGTR